jgi:hypothetical protein
MKYNEAMACLGVVVGTTNGWSDDKIISYAKQMQKWPDLSAVREACQMVADNWTRASAPPLGALREEYLNVLRRRAMEAPSNVFPIGRGACSAAEGRQIAANAYAEECKRLGREPTWGFFDRIIGRVDA